MQYKLDDLVYIEDSTSCTGKASSLKLDIKQSIPYEKCSKTDYKYNNCFSFVRISEDHLDLI